MIQQPYFWGICPHTWTIQLCISDSLPLVMMLPDDLWQTRPNKISPQFWQSISDGGGGLCRGIYLYNLICYLVGQLLRQSLQQSLHRSWPHCKPFDDRSSIWIMFGQTSFHVIPPLCWLWMNVSLICLPPPLKCLHIGDLSQSCPS